MAEVMNRAARRAAEAGKKGRDQAEMVPVRIRNQVAIVPMAHIETYFLHEIASEGPWASDVPLIILRPREDRGRAEGDWFPRTLDRMREARRRKGTLPMRIAIAEGMDVEIDIGLVDITVFFEMPGDRGLPRLEDRSEADGLLTENRRHLDMICAGGLHDQMIILMAMYFFHFDGSLLFHFHNLIFGMRQEVRGDVDILGPLDLDPLLKKLAESGPLGIIGGTKQ